MVQFIRFIFHLSLFQAKLQDLLWLSAAQIKPDISLIKLAWLIVKDSINFNNSQSLALPYLLIPQLKFCIWKGLFKGEPFVLVRNFQQNILELAAFHYLFQQHICVSNIPSPIPCKLSSESVLFFKKFALVCVGCLPQNFPLEQNHEVH